MTEPIILPIVEYARPIFEAQDPATAEERLAALDAWAKENQEIMKQTPESNDELTR